MTGHELSTLLTSPLVLLSILGIICTVAFLVMGSPSGGHDSDTGDDGTDSPSSDGRAIRSWVAGAVVLFALVGTIFSIALPSFIRARNTSEQNACIGNLRQIDSAKEQWAMEWGIADGKPVNTAQCNEYIKGNTGPSCPSGGTYTYNAIGTDPTCTITSPTSHVYAGA